MIGKHHSGESGFCCRSMKNLLRLSSAPVPRKPLKISGFLPSPCTNHCTQPVPTLSPAGGQMSTGVQGRAGQGPAEVTKEENPVFQTFMRSREERGAWTMAFHTSDESLAVKCMSISTSLFQSTVSKIKRFVTFTLEKDTLPPSSLEFSALIFKI